MLLQAALKVTFTKKKPVIERPRAPAAAAQIDGAVIGRMRQRVAAAMAAAARSNFVQSSRGFVSVLDFGLSFPSEKIMVLIFFHFFLFFSHPYAGLSFSTLRRLKHPKWTCELGFDL